MKKLISLCRINGIPAINGLQIDSNNNSVINIFPVISKFRDNHAKYELENIFLH